MSPQQHTIINHLRVKGSISNVEAQAIYRMRSPWKRISELKALGYTIRTEIKTDPTGQRYARYYWEGVA